MLGHILWVNEKICQKKERKKSGSGKIFEKTTRMEGGGKLSEETVEDVFADRAGRDTRLT